MMSPRKRISARARCVVKWLCVLVLSAFLFDAAFYEPYHPVLTAFNVAIPDLPASLDGFRVVQISDIHRGPFVSDGMVRRAVRLANTTHPGAVLLTGDFVSRNASNAAPCCVDLRDLRAKYGCYAVLGNHDYWTNSAIVSRAVTGAKITLLTNRSIRLPNSLRLVGVDDEWSGSPDEAAAFSEVKPGDPYLLMCHEPISVRRFAGRTGLLVTGHAHGGQVMLPVLTSWLVAAVHHSPYVSGWYRQGGILMYVNRGIGMVFPPLRFRCRPEVTLYVLHPAKQAKPYVMGPPA